MDTQILHFFNHELANPLLDVVMVLVSTAGLALLPAITLQIWLRGNRREASALFSALALALFFTLLFQFLALRPRPGDVRLLLAQPPFPSFPSGHAAAVSAVAAVLILRRRTLAASFVATLGVVLISLSRLYLGQHYPTDVAAGIGLGAAVGAACYGWFVPDKELPNRLRWLLFPQIAVAVLVSMMAYMDLLPLNLLQTHYIDKVLHFLLWGSLAFWLNLWLQDRRWLLAQRSLPLAICVPFSIALIEEGFQSLSPLRTADVRDLTADLLGLICFWWLSHWLLRRDRKQLPAPARHDFC